MKPNVVLITADHTRFDALACNGNPAVRTPHLDRLADPDMLDRGVRGQSHGLALVLTRVPHPLDSRPRPTYDGRLQTLTMEGLPCTG